MCCFWPVEVSQIHLQFLVHVLGPKHGPQGLKYLIFGFQTYIFSSA